MHWHTVMLFLYCTCIMAINNKQSWISRILCWKCRFNKADRMPTSTTYFRQLIVFVLDLEWVFLKDLWNYSILPQFCLSLHYKVVCVHMPGEVDSFNKHYSASTAAAICKKWWKSINNWMAPWKSRTSRYKSFFLPITQRCSISDVLFTGGRGVSDFSVLKCY